MHSISLQLRARDSVSHSVGRSVGLSVGLSVGWSVAEGSEHATYGDRPCSISDVAVRPTVMLKKKKNAKSFG